MTEQEKFGYNVKNILMEKNMTQKKLAELADIAESHISHIMSGKANLTIETMVKIADVLGRKLVIGLVPVEVNAREEVLV